MNQGGGPGGLRALSGLDQRNKYECFHIRLMRKAKLALLVSLLAIALFLGAASMAFFSSNHQEEKNEASTAPKHYAINVTDSVPITEKQK